MASTKDTKESKETLPSGDPEAAYVSPDLSNATESGALPDSEQEWNDDRDDAQQESVEAATAHEDKAAKARREAAEKLFESRAKGAEQKGADKPAPKPAPSSS